MDFRREGEAEQIPLVLVVGGHDVRGPVRSGRFNDDLLELHWHVTPDDAAFTA